jgi:hypothetical protein
MSLSMLLLLAQSSSALRVETDSPDALCPQLSVTREAVAARLGTLAAPKGWTARYTVGHAPDQPTGDFVRLRVYDPSGHLRMERDLPMVNGSCAEMARSIALLLDYYFRNLNIPQNDHNATEVVAESLVANQAPATKGQRAPSTRPLSEVEFTKVSSEHPVERRDWRLGLGLGRVSIADPAVLWLEGSRTFGGFVGGLNLILPFERDSETLGNSRLLLWTPALRAHWGPRLEASRFSAFVGPELLLALDHVAPRGLQHQSAQWRLVPGFGLSGDAAFWALPWLGIVWSVGLDWTPSKLTNRLMVQTPDSGGVIEVHRSPWVRGFVALGITFRVGP